MAMLVMKIAICHNVDIAAIFQRGAEFGSSEACWTALYKDGGRQLIGE